MEEQIRKFLSIYYGYGSGDGSGYGYGDGDGSGYGSGDGSGDGSGSGDGIKTFNGDKVYIIDDIPTIIKHVHDNVAKGYILNDDFTLTETFVAKRNGKFAHGETLHEAFASLQEKLYDDQPRRKGWKLLKSIFRTLLKRYRLKNCSIGIMC